MLDISFTHPGPVLPKSEQKNLITVVGWKKNVSDHPRKYGVDSKLLYG